MQHNRNKSSYLVRASQGEQLKYKPLQIIEHNRTSKFQTHLVSDRLYLFHVLPLSLNASLDFPCFLDELVQQQQGYSVQHMIHQLYRSHSAGSLDAL